MWWWSWLWLGILSLGVQYMHAYRTINAAQSENLIDVLSYHPELSTFTHLLQRTRLLPTLNRLQELDEEQTGITIFAPTNEAFEAIFMGSENHTLPDNVQAVLRQRLLYHVLNYTLPLEDQALQLYETLHLPSRKRLYEPTRPGPIPQKPQRPPEPGAEDHGGLLGNHGQYVRIQRDITGRVTHVGVDSRGQGGARCLDVDTRSSFGTLYIIDRVLDVPLPLDMILKTHNNTSVFRHISDDAMHRLATTPHLTMFLPVDAAWRSLRPLEQAYLFGGWPQAMDDWLRLFGWHTSSEGLGNSTVGYASLLRAAQPTRLTSILGGEVNITLSNQNQLQFGIAHIVEEDILTENGVVHLVDGLHMPFGDLGMTMEKYLLALNATAYVTLMKRAGLQHYINQDPHEPPRMGAPKGPFTFLIPSNAALDRWILSIPSGNDDISHLREMLLYHILPGNHHTFDKSSLLSTELYPAGLQGQAQRLPVSFTSGHVSFGAIQPVGEPLVVSNATVYLLDDVVRVPTDPVQTASHSSLSTFVHALSQTQKDDRVRDASAMTYLVPDDAGFESLGLVTKYLMHGPKSELDRVLSYHALPGLWYSDQLSSDWTNLPSWEGPSQSLRRDSYGLSVRSNTSEKLVATQRDLLTDTGVIHVVPRLRLPPSVSLSLYQLAQVSHARRMMQLIDASGFQWVWNETYSMETKGTCERQKVVLLLPSDAAFNRINFTEYERSPALLQTLVAQHVLLVDDCDTIPNMRFDFPLTLKDEAQYPSLLDKSVGGSSRFGALALRHVGNATASRIDYMIGIKNARRLHNHHHAARITDFGRVFPAVLSQGVVPGGILILDTVLEPYSPGWLRRWDRLWRVALLLLILYIVYEAYLYVRIRYGGYTRLQEGTMDGEEE